jgi:hypothetical protein
MNVTSLLYIGGILFAEAKAIVWAISANAVLVFF